jgi:hypothetical protein
MLSRKIGRIVAAYLHVLRHVWDDLVTLWKLQLRCVQNVTRGNEFKQVTFLCSSLEMPYQLQKSSNAHYNKQYKQGVHTFRVSH